MTDPTTARLLGSLDTQVEATRRALCALRLDPSPDVDDYLWHIEQVADLYKLCGEHASLLTATPPTRDTAQVLTVLGRTAGCLGQAGAHLGFGLGHLPYALPTEDGASAAGESAVRTRAALAQEVHQARTELFLAHSALHCEIQRLRAPSPTRTPGAPSHAVAAPTSPVATRSRP
ncbi:hypothetical protein [Streptacidiphilus jiangxiensis]|uniref:Uncharacterized protein n=1 Tax=Streptacidiphilus jiangxiensis TaxID=235985 RepID=A0A1H8A4L0_STRJI|nr:hypothetical protein [Streptacidiphilus jiangxiensis]SEM65640.1 hypothetical protein SAMN05414137_1418 [Streptacidiphilus jiangxiensis]